MLLYTFYATCGRTMKPDVNEHPTVCAQQKSNPLIVMVAAPTDLYDLIANRIMFCVNVY